MAETEYKKELKKYFHLSNSGLTAVLSRTDASAKYPHVKIELKTGTFGVMNTALELISCNHTEEFMSVKDLLELSSFFAEAAKLTNEVEIESYTKKRDHWTDIVENSKFDGSISSQERERMRKHWRSLEAIEEASLNKCVAEQRAVAEIASLVKEEIDAFNAQFYPKKILEEASSSKK